MYVPGNNRLESKLMLEEFQLLAEQKWITEALSKIRKQRNALEIERLQLESLKTKTSNLTSPEKKCGSKKDSPKPSTSKQVEEIDLDDASAFNRKELDLSIMNSLDIILEGNFCDTEEDETEEET